MCFEGEDSGPPLTPPVDEQHIDRGRDVQRTDSCKFEMMSLAGHLRPQREVTQSVPHSTALEWHQANVFRG
jgi:hypothetical protein